MKKQWFKCPACGKKFELFDMRTHWADTGDDEHIKLELGIEVASDDAYFEAEVEFVVDNCETVNPVKRRKK